MDDRPRLAQAMDARRRLEPETDVTSTVEAATSAP